MQSDHQKHSASDHRADSTIEHLLSAIDMHSRSQSGCGSRDAYQDKRGQSRKRHGSLAQDGQRDG